MVYDLGVRAKLAKKQALLDAIQKLGAGAVNAGVLGFLAPKGSDTRRALGGNATLAADEERKRKQRELLAALPAEARVEYLANQPGSDPALTGAVQEIRNRRTAQDAATKDAATERALRIEALKRARSDYGMTPQMIAEREARKTVATPDLGQDMNIEYDEFGRPTVSGFARSPEQETAQRYLDSLARGDEAQTQILERGRLSLEGIRKELETAGIPSQYQAAVRAGQMTVEDVANDILRQRIIASLPEELRAEAWIVDAISKGVISPERGKAYTDRAGKLLEAKINHLKAQKDKLDRDKDKGQITPQDYLRSLFSIKDDILRQLSSPDIRRNEEAKTLLKGELNRVNESIRGLVGGSGFKTPVDRTARVSRPGSESGMTQHEREARGR